MDLLDIAIIGGLGAALGGAVAYLTLISRMKGRFEARRGVQAPALKATGRAAFSKVEVEKAKREMNAILLEKDLMSSALTRVYEAEVDGKINKEERDELAARYKKRLKEIEERLGDVEVTIEVYELERLRGELVGLFERKIGEIDSRLQQAHVKLERLAGPLAPPVVEVSGEQLRVERRRVKAEGGAVDEKVKALREEVLEALARLEQMDAEG